MATSSIHDMLRVDRDVGHIELGIVDNRTLEIVNASERFFRWINRPPATRVSLPDLIPRVTTEMVQRALRENDGVCEVEESFSSSTGMTVTLRLRLLETSKSGMSPLRFLAYDVSEMRRKEEILRMVSGYLEEHKNMIAESRKTLKALLDSLPQAVFMIDSSFRVTSETSETAQRLFGEAVTDKSFLDISGLDRVELEPLELAFSGVPWDLMAGVLPKEFVRGNRIFALSFVPLYEEQKLESVTIIVNDITEQRNLERSLKQTDADNRALVGILGSKDEFFDLVNLVQKASEVCDSLSELRPIVHSLKGGFSFLECEAFARKCHAIEEEINASGYTPDIGRRLSHELGREIEAFLRRYGEILHVSGDQEREWQRRSVQVDYEAIGNFFRKAKQEGAAPELLQAIECLAEVPVSTVLSWLDKAWRKTLLRESKEGNPIQWVGSVRIAREPYSELFQSFVHIIRNAVDHGIQLPEERVWQGKNRAGSLTISTSYEDGVYRFEFTDDGAGIDAGAVVETARKRGMQVKEGLPREGIFMLLCEPEFSSKSEITELSGRGVGLDAVRRAARTLGGDVSISSEKGKGTTISVWFRRQRCW